MLMPYNEQLCDERHKNIEVTEKAHDSRLRSLETSVNGNGKFGLVAKVDTLWHWYKSQTATQAGLLDWAFRVGISIILAYIAVKVGLK